jgi:taurine dioxygenase
VPAAVTFRANKATTAEDAMTFTVNEISPAGAVEILDYDCRSDDPGAFAQLRETFLAHPIVCIRNQTLSPTEQASFARRWGALEGQDRSAYCHPEDKDVLILSNERRPDGSQVGIVDAGDFWHSDSSHIQDPCLITMLYAIKNPMQGGDTHFLNMVQVYEALPEELKRRIAGRDAVHHISKLLNPRVAVSSERAGAADYYKAREKETKPVTQPMVRTHPITGRQALYISPRFTIAIDGMPDAEAQPLLDELFRFMFSDTAWQYTHKWKDGDFVFWDNACLNHMAGGGYQYPDTRRMHRTTIAGTRPFYRPQAA